MGWASRLNPMARQPKRQASALAVPQMKACPCCRCLTLEVRGNYDICPVCFWEDEGDCALDVSSPPNHGLTLAEGRENYARIGACEPDLLRYVRPPKHEELPATEVK